MSGTAFSLQSASQKARAGAESAMVFAYFLIIAVAGLRFSLRLVWLATLGSLAGYLVLLVVRDPDWFGGKVNAVEVRGVEEIIVLLSLGLSGIIVGQLVRRTKAMARDFARRVADSQQGAP